MLELLFSWSGDKEPVWAFAAREDGKRSRSGDFVHDEDGAFSALHRGVAAAQRDGYTLVIDGVEVAPADPVFAPQPELEARVHQRPDDLEAWSVLTDAWLEAGDSRGVLAIEAAPTGDPAEFMRRREASEKARVAAIGSLYAPLGDDGYRMRPVFRRGVVDELRVDLESQAPGRPCGELVEHLLGHPMGRFVREIIAVRAPGDQVSRAIGRIQPDALRVVRLHTRGPVALEHLVRGAANLETLVVSGRLRPESLPPALAAIAGHSSLASVAIEDYNADPETETLVDDWLERARPHAKFRFNRLGLD